VVLNRPTSTAAYLDDPFDAAAGARRRLSFGGDAQLRAGSGVDLQLDANGVMWLHHRAEALGGSPLGASGVWRTWAARAAAQLRRGEAALDDFLLVSGLVPFEAGELAALHVEMKTRPIWPSNRGSRG